MMEGAGSRRQSVDGGPLKVRLKVMEEHGARYTHRLLRETLLVSAGHRPQPLWRRAARKLLRCAHWAIAPRVPRVGWPCPGRESTSFANRNWKGLKPGEPVRSHGHSGNG